MKPLALITTSVLLFFTAVGSAHALSYSYSDTYSAADPYMSNFFFIRENTSINSPVIWEVDTGLYNFSITSDSSLSDLSSSGTIEATLTALWGDFYFSAATLFADAAQPVPEPASMLLLGTGLAGLAGMARRRKNSKKVLHQDPGAKKIIRAQRC